jgi:hypothetical protein
MMYHLTKDRGDGDDFLRFAVFSICDANFVEIKHQFGYTALYVVVQILNYSLEKRFRYLRVLPFLRATCYLDNLIRMPMNEGIYQSSSRFDLELRRTIIHDFCSRDWCVLFCVLLNPVEDLLFMISVEGDILPGCPGSSSQCARAAWT